MSKDLVADFDAALRAAGDPIRAEHERRYLKSNREHVLAEVVQELWGSPLFEANLAAVELLTYNLRVLGPADLPLIEHPRPVGHRPRLLAAPVGHARAAGAAAARGR